MIFHKVCLRGRLKKKQITQQILAPFLVVTPFQVQCFKILPIFKTQVLSTQSLFSDAVTWTVCLIIGCLVFTVSPSS